LWLHGTDLADLYRGELSLRQVWVRVTAVLMADPNAPLRRSLTEAEEKAESARREADLDDVLNRYRKG
jgi:hypothetical protein